MSNFLKWFLAFVIITGLFGCSRDKCMLADTELASIKHFPEDIHSDISDDPRVLVDELYPYSNVVEIELVNAKFHTEKLLEAESPEDAAYHIIAIGLLRKDSPEIRNALLKANEKFGAEWIPLGYDWPDAAARFRERFIEEYPDGAGIPDYPGSRHADIHLLFLECAMRIGWN